MQGTTKTAVKDFTWMTVAAVMVFTAGCGRKTPSGAAGPNDVGATAAAGELVVLCGSSFVNPTNQIIEEFNARTGIKLTPTVSGSEDFLPLVRVGSRGDVLITHDPYLDHVADANKLADSVQVGYVAPVLAVAPGNPKNITKIEDLTKEGLRVALSDPRYSTAGEMVFALLENKGIKDAVLANVGNRLTKGHSNLGTLLKTGAVDAIIIWNGVAHTFADSLEVVPTPYEYDEEIRVHVIGLNYTGRPDALRKFLEFTKERGPDVFREHGYVK